MKISFLIMTEYLKHQQIYTMLKMIEAARAKNHEIHGIFFFGTAVINLVKKVEVGRNTRNIPAVIIELSKEKIPIYACQTWADYFGIFDNLTDENIKIMGLGELSTMAYESDKLIAFGART